ncbi:MFS transporter [Bacteroidia bacterium]|nr:MFS transporter [Bacteroidia bacterium]
MSAFYFVQGLVYATWTSRIPDIKNTLSLNNAEWGGLIFLIPIGEIATMALSGYLVSRYGSKFMLSIAAILYPLSLIFIGVASSFWQLGIALFLFGTFAVMSNISVNTQAIGVERLYKRSIMGAFHGLWSLAGFTGGLLGMAMVALHLSPLQHFGIVAVIIFVIVLNMRRSVLPRDRQRQVVEQQPRRIFTRPDRYILIVGLIALGSMVCEGTVYNWSGIYFERVLVVPTHLIRLGYITAMCCMTIGRFAIDGFITRFGAINVLRVSGALMLAGLFLVIGTPHIALCTIGFGLVGAGMSSIIPICYSLAGRSSTMLPGIAIATISSISFLGLLMGPSVIGVISESIGLRWTLCIVALFAAFIVMLTKPLKRMLK